MKLNEQKLSLWTLRLALFGLGLIVLSTIMFRFGLMSYQLPLLGVALATLVCLMGVLVGDIALFVSFRNGKLNRQAALGIFIAISVTIVPVLGFFNARSHPIIHDISTDLKNPPQFSAILSVRPADANSLETSQETMDMQKQSYPDMSPMVVSMPASDAFERAVAVSEAMGWDVIEANPAKGTIEAVVATALFGFKDDVVIRVVSGGDKTSRVDMRSVSRVGRGDLGANAKRINSFMTKMKLPK